MEKVTLEKYNKLHLQFIELSKKINEVIEEQAIDISREQLGVFKLLLENKNMSLKEIAFRQGVHKTAVTKRIKKMEEKGYVKKIKSQDKREKLIALTTQGHKFYQHRQELLYKGLEKKLNLNKENLDIIINKMNDIQSILKPGDEIND